MQFPWGAWTSSLAEWWERNLTGSRKNGRRQVDDNTDKSFEELSYKEEQRNGEVAKGMSYGETMKDYCIFSH